ncbi:MAG: ferredoxin--NADP reductase [Alphaproteobacteria bacterium]|nr:ferredoxin--NADP(+) reductase [Rhodobiaceae bacterium]MBO6544176.1 ferredoxin--NADP reductase [Alphaproteobacteria bacterium]MBO6627710.1 ferredoxin--NADP reductase [Alphaproteobacteria bacterium]MDF1627492.1 ferredoxin--NADP reductase [Parvibaculaceae bacterium]|tara:strand:- start:52 stop:861 length:810 start_codon:yes stop_codon:yes gene_type:complete
MTEILASSPKASPKGPTSETVLQVEHYTNRLFRFSLSRPASFRFRSGEFVMIGLPGENGRPIMRAYSVASPSWDEKLEFYSIKVPDGPLTSKLQKIEPGDEVLLGKKPTGTLVLDALTPGKRLYMFSTGTGFAPFASLIRDPETYEKYEEVIVTHTCRESAELDYSRELVRHIEEDPMLSELVDGKLRLYTTCTREDHDVKGRITDLISNGKLFEDLGVPTLDPETDRAMICGSMEMTQDTKKLLMDAGFEEGSNAAPAQFVIEKAFVG